MKLSVVIVNYNVKYFLEQCLRSARKALENMEAEIFVVDNNSSDGSMEHLKPLFPEVVFIENKDNPGFSKANNQAIRQAKGEYVLLLNPDTVVGEDAFENVCRFMDEHPDSGGVGVRMIDGYGNFLPESKRGFPNPWNSFCKMFGLSKIFSKSPIFAQYHLRYLDEKKVHKVDVLAGAFMMLRKSVLDKIGLLDETFFMYGEDIDLSYRIILGGYANYYLPETIIHYKGESTKKDIRYVKIFYEAMLIFFRKHYPNYSGLYSFFVHFAIYIRASFSALNTLIFSPRNRKIKTTQNHLVFSTDEMDYKTMFEYMLKNKPAIYHIYHPENKILISSSQIFTDINKNNYGLPRK